MLKLSLEIVPEVRQRYNYKPPSNILNPKFEYVNFFYFGCIKKLKKALVAKNETGNVVG